MSSDTTIVGDLIARTEAYVAASNAHDVEAIRPMFADDAVYRSTGAGEHVGAEAILQMMKTFFEANPDVHWDARDFRRIGNDGVEFDFTITLDSSSGNGVERLFFSPTGLIRLIEVER